MLTGALTPAVHLMLGTPAAGRAAYRAHPFKEYVHRLFNQSQMDFDYTFWQMLYLCISPSKVYRQTSYHKQTKNQWARDDPAFVVILVYFLVVSVLAYAVAFHVPSVGALFKLILAVVLRDFLSTGVLIATIFWWISNKYLRVQGGGFSVEQDVEWLYAFDIHCNAFFPAFLVIVVLQYFFIHLMLGTGIVAVTIGNAIYSLVIVYYYYVTFLGYSALPFLSHTIYFFWYPVGVVAIAFILSILLRISFCQLLVGMYF
jgi:hypothetical protein